MYRADTNDSWHWSEDVSPAVDFCVRTLRRDGLRVLPFDRHPEGDASLRKLGLTAEAWIEWVHAVVAAQGRIAGHLRTHAFGEDRDTLARLVRAARLPAEDCPGSLELRARLAELWTAFEPEGGQWKREMTADRRRAWFDPRQERRLWSALEPLRARLPTLSVFLVDYPETAVLPVPPTSCLIAQRVATRDGSLYTASILQAAEALAS